MTTYPYDPVRELSRLISAGALSVDALAAILDIDRDRLPVVLAATTPGMSGSGIESSMLSEDETMRLSVLAGQLTEGLPIGDDDRLRAILESLTIEFHLTTENIARLTALDTADLEVALRDPQALPADRTYALASRCSYLLNAIGRARGR